MKKVFISFITFILCLSLCAVALVSCNSGDNATIDDNIAIAITTCTDGRTVFCHCSTGKHGSTINHNSECCILIICITSSSVFLSFLDFPLLEITNSFHHQAVKLLGSRLKGIYYSIDGEVECFVHEKHPIIAVQFHPEMDMGNEFYLMVLMYFKNLFSIFKS